MKAKRKKKRSKKSSKSAKNILILLAFAGLFLFFCFASNVFKSPQEKFTVLKSVGKIRLTPPPATPTPTEIPSPTPVPLIGYCLKVPVLMYHHVQPDAEADAKGQKALSVDNGAFDQQMGYLVSNGYSIISAGQLVSALVSNTGLPAKSIVITFDDGYNDIYNYAFPILRKYNIIGNLAVVTGLVNGADYVSWSQVEEMSHSGLMNMLNHTWSHYSITQNAADKVKYEISTAKLQLQDHTGQNIDMFVYPYGFINSGAIAALQQEGIRGAFSGIGGHWQCDSFIMALHRTRIGNSPLANYGL